MKIPRNFDRWMFDYKEGNLSQSEISYFENYMSENPQFNSDISAWNESYIKKESIVYAGASTLQRKNKVLPIIGWAATLLILISSTLGLYTLIQHSVVQKYTQRFSKDNLINTNLFNSKQTVNIQLSPISNHNNLLSQVDNSNLTTIDKDNKTDTENSNKSSELLNQSTHNQHYNSKLLLEGEFNKVSDAALNESRNNASYKNNPKYKNNSIKQSSKKRKSYKSSFNYKLKKLIRTIEVMSSTPVRLTNLKDPDFLTPNSNLLDKNVGFVGGYGGPRFETRYRTQWLGSENNLQSSNMNFDTYSKALRGGIGIALKRDDFNNGAYVNKSLNLYYAPKFALTDKIYFEPAVKLALGLMSMNTSKIDYNSTYEIDRGLFANPKTQLELPTANNLWYKDYALGFLINADKFYIGFNADNINEHSESIYGLNQKSAIKYNAIFGIDYQSKTKNTTFSPFVNYIKENNRSEIWAGTNIKFNWFTIGGAYSTNNDYSASIGTKFKTFKLIYQYDRTTSELSATQFGSHTIGLRLNTSRKTIR